MSGLQVNGPSHLTQAGTAQGTEIVHVVQGQTCTITIASPGVITATAHGKAADDKVMFTTDGALPTGLTANTIYFVRNPATNTFEVSATAGGSSINTSGTQSGTHTVFGNSRRITTQDIANLATGLAISDTTGLQAELDAKLDDSQAGATGLAVLAATTQAAARTAIGAGTGTGDLVASNNLSDVASATTSRTNLGVGTGDSPQFAGVNIGHASDTTVTRTGAGDIAVGGNAIYRAGGTDVPVADGGTGASTAAGARTNLGLGTIATEDEATAAQIQAGTAAKAVAADKLAAAAAPQTLTDAATVSWDMSLGFNAKVTLGGNRTLAVSNPVVGWTYCLGVIQDGTGSRTLTWPASFDWGTTGAPTLTTTASKRDRITLFCTDAATPKFDAFLSGKGFS